MRWVLALTVSALLAMLVGFSFFYLLFSSIINPRGFLILYILLSLTLLMLWRYVYISIVKRKKELVHILFVGYESIVEEIIPYLEKDNYFEYRMMGIFETSKELQECITASEYMIKNRQELLEHFKQELPDIIVISDEKTIDKDIKNDLFNLMGEHQFILLHDFYEILLRKIPIGSIHDSWVLSNIDTTSKRLFFIFKRIFDIVISFSILCIIFFPSLLLAIAIKLDSKGSVFFKQVREGMGGRRFTIIKFRTMKIEGNTFTPTEKKDARVTRLGRFLRQTRLDEFPQFINVLKGDMSIIGPRPERPELSLTFKTEVPFYKQRLLVRPGITGWSQISDAYDYPTVEETCKKVQLDLYYIKNCSLLLDASILLKTVAILFLRIGI